MIGAGGIFLNNLTKNSAYDIITLAASPERGCLAMCIISFLLSVLASVAANYICKWLDGDK